jgi:hypothetical protein
MSQIEQNINKRELKTYLDGQYDLSSMIPGIPNLPKNVEKTGSQLSIENTPTKYRQNKILESKLHNKEQ